ncbi:hypothetical protein GCM10010492_28710 [Saccharothrix mutabilis subsp. mutabilis]|uniref:Uncharacterized protein n=1 Tax=Saccharothrix mutabilis subsp. mutabilis TaxID=66855 RepID=A0ABP3DDU4_9PSEU
MLGQVAEPDARVQVDQVQPHLAQPQPRHPVGQEHPRDRVHDLRLPRGRGQVAGGGGEPLARRVQVGAQQLRLAGGALDDVGVAVRPTQVHGVLDAGLRPRQQVHQRVRVACEMRHDVRPAPARQQARSAQKHVVKGVDSLVEGLGRPLDLGEARDGVLRGGRLLPRRGYARLGGSDLGGISEAHGHLIPGVCGRMAYRPSVGAIATDR